VFTVLHPQVPVVVPQPDVIRLPPAYPLARRRDSWEAFMNTWIELRPRAAIDRLTVTGSGPGRAEGAAALAVMATPSRGGVTRPRAGAAHRVHSGSARYATCPLESEPAETISDDGRVSAQLSMTYSTPRVEPIPTGWQKAHDMS
jgi:hypothetical protein